jgi:hypothetical protein
MLEASLQAEPKLSHRRRATLSAPLQLWHSRFTRHENCCDRPISRAIAAANWFTLQRVLTRSSHRVRIARAWTSSSLCIAHGDGSDRRRPGQLHLHERSGRPSPAHIRSRCCPSGLVVRTPWLCNQPREAAALRPSGRTARHGAQGSQGRARQPGRIHQGRCARGPLGRLGRAFRPAGACRGAKPGATADPRARNWICRTSPGATQGGERNGSAEPSPIA